MSTNIQDLIVHSIQTWLVEHPVLFWIVTHPLWTIAGVLLALLLGWSLLGAIAQAVQQVCLFVLKSPLKLAQLLLRKVFQSVKRPDTVAANGLNTELEMQKRLPEILNRLETLRQEQEILIKEMHSILLSKS